MLIVDYFDFSRMNLTLNKNCFSFVGNNSLLKVLSQENSGTDYLNAKQRQQSFSIISDKAKQYVFLPHRECWIIGFTKIESWLKNLTFLNRLII